MPNENIVRVDDLINVLMQVRQQLGNVPIITEETDPEDPDRTYYWPLCHGNAIDMGRICKDNNEFLTHYMRVINGTEPDGTPIPDWHEPDEKTQGEYAAAFHICNFDEALMKEIDSPKNSVSTRACAYVLNFGPNPSKKNLEH